MHMVFHVNYLVLTLSGFEKPSLIQTKVMPLVCSGTDVVFQAPPGTGKAAALILPLLWKLDPSSRTSQVMIIAPSRELAVQLAKVTEALADYMNIRVACLIGGERVRDSIQVLQQKPQVVIGTGMSDRIF